MFRNIRTNQTKAHNDSAHKGGTTIAGRSPQLKMKRVAAVLAAAAVCGGMMLGSVSPVFADDTINTVPSDEGYRSEIHTYLENNTALYGPGFGPYSSSNTGDKVRQSTSRTSATTFASGLPLGTIYIDQTKIGKGILPTKPIEWLVDDTSVRAGLNYDSGTGTVTYKTDGSNASSVKELSPNQLNEFDGNLFALTFGDAAVLPNGDRADVKIIYSNARIVVDQRISGTFKGEIRLAQGSSFAYGVKSDTQFAASDTTTANKVANYISTNFPALDSNYRSFKNSDVPNPVVGSSMDARYCIVDKSGVPVHGSFVFAITGINLDRDPGRGQQQAQKPLWYTKDFASSYNYFSEAMSINDGQASEYIYVRSNDNDIKDNPKTQDGNTNITGAHFFPHVGLVDGKVRITSNAYMGTQAYDESYSSGFVTLADAAEGLAVTGIGYGGGTSNVSNGFNTTMNTNPFSSAQIWYRYTSGTGAHGNIQTTSDGNFNGKLNDGGDVLEPGTYVVTEGKTITYTMTPDIGYKLSKLTINGNNVEFDNKAVSRMKKGDSLTTTTAAGNEAELKYEDDGTYTFKLKHANKDEEVYVEWEPTTADVLASKIWRDGNDTDGMRADAYASGKTPKLKLQQSLNGGRTWEDVSENSFKEAVAEQNVPSGNDEQSGQYLDGTFTINNGTDAHPYTWEYLPVYTYDSNGIADKVITYRIVEDPETGIADYQAAKYFDAQSFDLTSEEIKTHDGWIIYRDDSNNEYILKGDGQYYSVNDWTVTNDPASTQPDAGDLHAATSGDKKIIDGLQVYADTTNNKEYVKKSDDKYYEVINDSISTFAAKTQPSEANLRKAMLNGYTTADKALKYQSVQVKNEHTPNKIYVEVTKKWDDEAVKDLVTSSETNQYSRKSITFVLHGETESGTTVDLDTSDDSKTDLELVVSTDEADTREAAIGETGDGTYKTDADNFGAYFKNLPTHENGKKITYTISEIIDGKTANSSELAWITTGGTLTPDTDNNGELLGYKASFVNTPNVEDVYEVLPLTVVKRDANTEGLLEGAEFTVYTNAVSKTKAVSGTDVESNTVVTGTNGQATVKFLQPGTYYIVETKAPVGYTADDKTYQFQVDKDLKSITLQSADAEGHSTSWWKKLWDLLFNDGVPSNANWVAATDKKGGTLTVDDEPLTASVLVRKYWDDNSDQDDVRPDDGDETMPQVILMWTTSAHTAAGLPVYKDKDNDALKYVHKTDNKFYKVIAEDQQGVYSSAAAQPQPDSLSATSETCQGRKVYSSGSDPELKKYVYVDGAYHEVGSVDTAGSVEGTAADPQPKEADVRLVMDEGAGWQQAQIREGDSSTAQDAKASVTYAGGPVLTHQHDAYTWNNVPAYRDGKPVTYRVFENSTLLTDGTYSMKYSHTSETNEKVFTLVNSGEQSVTTHNQTVDVTNEHKTQTINIEAYKTWKDDSANDRKEASLTLYKIVNGATSVVTKLDENGHNVHDKGTVPTTIEGDDWTRPVKTWTGLPAFENGYPVTYKIEESAINAYKTDYSIKYKKAASGSESETEIDTAGDSVDASTVKRTFEADGDENTTAKFTITNEETIDVTVRKTWRDGANANVEYQLWRTATPKDQLQITALKNTDNIIYYESNNEPKVRISEQAYSALPDTDKSNYYAVNGYTWTPYGSDGNLTEGWEKVVDENGDQLTHTFIAADFSVTDAEDTKSFTFRNLAKNDSAGHEYLYRVTETPKLVRFGSNQADSADAAGGSDLHIRNINLQAQDAVATFDVVKELSGREWKSDDRFFFEIEASGGKNITDNSDIAAEKVPMPRRQYIEGSTVSTEIINTAQTDIDETVGALGRKVPFASIIYKENYSSAPDAFQHYYGVAKGKTVEFYYTVREVYSTGGKEQTRSGVLKTKTVSIDEATNHTGTDSKGVSYEGTVEDGKFKPTEHRLTVRVSNTEQGQMSTEVFWDNSSTANSVPVITNTYDASAPINAYIVKQIQGREFESGDSFKFFFANLPGSVVRTSVNDPAVTEYSGATTSTIEYNTKTKVEPAGDNGKFKPSAGTDTSGGSYRAAESDLTGYFKLSDLYDKTSDGRATGTFIYELYERDYDSTDDASTAANGNDLELDDDHIYMKVVVTDNMDGTLDVRSSYHTEASCTDDNKINANVLVYAADVEGNILGIGEHKKGELAPAGASVDDTDSEGNVLYEYIPAALFTNNATIDIPVKKEWVGGPAVEDVTLRLQRHLFPLSAEANLDGSKSSESDTNLYGDEYVRSEYKRWADEDQAFWVSVGNVYNVQRGDFINEDGSIRYDSGSSGPSSKLYENIKGFNKDLPKYVTEGGTTYRVVYRLIEDDTSDAYDTSYSSIQDGSSEPKAGDNIFIDSGTMVVTNTVKATNTANIAAVKQLLGRQWLSSDDFKFSLEPLGKAIYNDKDEIDALTWNVAIPMPKTDSEIDSETTGEGADAVAVAHAKSAYQTVDTNGGLERLARFGSITYKVSDLAYDNTDKHMQGDFFYRLKEVIPDDAVNSSGIKYKDATTAQKEAGGFSINGITYDTDEHLVHVKVRENRTGQLQVQVAYDEETQGDVSTGTMFTPVFTNKYSASGTTKAKVSKIILGREFSNNDAFDFTIQPIGGSVFRYAAASEFAQDGEDDETALNDGRAVVITDGAYRMRLKPNDRSSSTIPEAENRNKWREKTFPALKFTDEDLASVSTADQLKYSDGSDVPAGMAYGEFTYMIKEVASISDDVNTDSDTEYVKFTVIDKGDGTLDISSKYYENRECTELRYELDNNGEKLTAEATSSPFVNQIRRTVKATKAWAGQPTGNVTLRLRWSVDEGADKHWYNVERATFMNGVDSTKTIARNASGEDLSVTWTELPAYADIYSAADQTHDHTNSNDKWIYYQVVEENMENVEAMYSSEPYVSGDTKETKTSDGADKYSAAPLMTGEAKDGEGNWNDNSKAAEFFVTNFRKEIKATAKFGVVKQLIGKEWDDESFSFEVTPVKSRLGSETEYTDASDRAMPTATSSRAAAEPDSSAVSVNERLANFEGVTIKLSDLKAKNGVDYGEFIYKITEVIPSGAIKVTEGSGDAAHDVYYCKNSDGNWVKYTNDEHTVKIVAQDDGSGKLDIDVSYDDRESGKYVPVYTNYVMAPTPVEGTKTWIGGEKSEHVNGTVSTDESGAITSASDNLGLQLYQQLDKPGAEKTPITEDAAGRDLVFVWVRETQTTTTTYVDEDGAEISEDEYNAITEESERDKYTKVTNTSYGTTPSVNSDGLFVDKSDKGYYTVKAKGGDNYADPLLDATDPNGVKYSYSISETKCPAGYTKSESGMDVTNTHTGTDSLSVSKTWDDDNDAEGIRPDAVNVHLYKEVTENDGSTTKKVQVEVHHQSIEKGTDGSYSIVTWDDLPVYDSDGEKIKYIVEEEAVSGYTATYGPDPAEETTERTYYEKGNEALKIVLDGNTEAAAQSIDIKNSLTPATDSVKVTKVWDDGSDVDGKRPENVTFDVYEYVWNKTEKKYGSASKVDGKSLTLNSGNAKQTTTGEGDSAVTTTDTDTWEGEVTGLARTKNGKTVIYTVKEDPEQITDYEKAVVTGDQVSGFTVTNKHAPETTTASITKNWVDKNNALNTRPKTVTFRLMRTYEGLSTPEQVDRPSDSSKKVVVKLSADDGDSDDSDTWSKTIRNLPKNILVEGSPKPITYFWQEVVPVGYTATGKLNNADVDAVEGDNTKTISVDDNSTVTNTFITGTLTVTKTWDDENDSEKLRPTAEEFASSVRLFAGNTEITAFNNGSSGITRERTAGTGDKSNEYYITYSNLPVYDSNGSKITYKIEESAISNYEISGTPELTSALNRADGETEWKGALAITNKHVPDTVDVEVTKNWFDAEDEKGSHAHMSTSAYANHVALYADGVAVKNASESFVRPTVTADGDSAEGEKAARFTLKWEKLPRYKVSGGKLVEIVYSAKEDNNIEGYAEISPDNPVATGGVSVYDNKGCLDQANKNKLDAAYNGGEINNIQLINIDVVKTWDDDSDHDGKRPDTIKVKLFRNGVAFRDELTLNKNDAVMSADNNTYTWSKAWRDLPYADRFGVPYNYTAVEIENGSWYQALIGTEPMHQVLLSKWKDDNKYDTLVFELTNRYDPEKISFTVDKIWDDHSDADNLRPSQIEYTLKEAYDGHDASAVTTLPEGTSIIGGTFSNGTITVFAHKYDSTQGTSNTVTISGLPKYAENGKTITYSIEETAVTGYSTAIYGDQNNGYTVINSHLPVSTTVTPQIRKVISGRSFRLDGSEKDEFTFLLEAETNGAPLPSRDHITIKPSETQLELNTVFGPITFTGADMADTLTAGHSKLFTYKVTEVNGGRTINDLKYDGSVLIYVVTVTRNEDGSISASDEWHDGKNTFTNVYHGTVDLTLRKVWVDEDADHTVIGTRPSAVTFKVTAATSVETPALVEDGFVKADNEGKKYTAEFDINGASHKVNDATWERVVSGLPKYDTAGERITYSVSEDRVPNYSRPHIDTRGNVFIVTNTYEDAEFHGTKVWVDDQKHDNASELKDKLTLERTTTPSVDNSWEAYTGHSIHFHWNNDGNKVDHSYTQSFVITGLPKEDSAGNAYVYRVTENLGADYSDYHVTYSNANDSTTADFNEADDAEHLYNNGTVTNKQGAVEISGTKTWIGGEEDEHVNADSNGDKLGISLYRHVRGGEENKLTDDDSGKTLTVVWSRETGNSGYVFKAKNGETVVDANLNEYDDNHNKYIYTVKETAAPENYHAHIDGFNITNTSNSMADITVTKVWAGDDNDRTHRGTVKVQLYQTVDGAKKAVGDPVELAKGQDYSESMSHTWSDMPVYSDNHKITYTVEEINVPAEYTSKVEYGVAPADGQSEKTWTNEPGKDWDHTVRVTNTLGTDDAKVVVQKHWNDNDDQDGLRPGSVTVSLMVGDKKAVNKEGHPVEDIVLDDNNNWKSAFTDLPKTDQNGAVIDYRVVETEVSGYTATYEYGSTEDGNWHDNKPGDNGSKWNYKVLIRNTHKTDAMTIKASKVWAGDDQVGKSLRTDVVLHLYGMDADGLIVYDAGTKEISMGENGEPKNEAEWTEVPKHHYSDTELTWKVVEEPVFGYTSSVSGNFTDGFVVTNTYTGPTTSVKVTKEWKDTYYDNFTGLPESVTYQLVKKVGDQDPKVVDEKTVSASEDWSYEWRDLPVTEMVKAGGAEETTNTEYQNVQKTDANGNLVFKEISTGNEVSYTQEDYNALNDDAKSNLEPVMIEHVPEEVTETHDKTEEVPVLYSVTEKYDDSLKNKGYQEPVVVSEGPGEFRVINIHETKTTSYVIKKAWNDQDDADRLRPNHVTVRLMNGDTEVRKAVVTSEDEWEHKFMNVPVTDSEGNSITYTVKENDVEGYTSTYPDSLSTESANTITNTHQAGSVVSLRAVKKWSGDDSDKSKRKAVTFHLVKVYVGEDSRIRKVVYGKEYDKTASEENDWTAVWDEKLPTAEKGNKIFWTVEEEAVDGYNDSVGDSKEVYTAVAIAEGDNPKEKGLYEKDGEESYKLTEDIRPVADKDYFALTFEVTVTNTKQVTPAPPAPADNSHYDVIYVDPRNPVGKNAMIVQSTKYDTYEEARKAAESGADTMPSGGIKAAEADADKPKDPSHEDVQFIGWDLNWDENDNFVLVATYSDIPEEVTPVVSYVDGQAKDPLLKSKITNDPSSVKKPKDPKHKNLQFTGWKKTVDAGGNTIFVASYKPDCKNGSGDSTSNTYRTGNGKPHVKTGDENAEIVLWILVLIMASALMAIYVYDRRRNYRQ